MAKPLNIVMYKYFRIYTVQYYLNCTVSLLKQCACVVTFESHKISFLNAVCSVQHGSLEGEEKIPFNRHLDVTSVDYCITHVDSALGQLKCKSLWKMKETPKVLAHKLERLYNSANLCRIL